MVPKPMSSMNAFKNIIGRNSHQSQSEKHLDLDSHSPTGDRRHYHNGDSLAPSTAQMSPALKRSLLNDLKPMMRKVVSSRSLVSLTSLNNNASSNPSSDDAKVGQPTDAHPRRLSKKELSGQPRGTTSSPLSIDYDYGPQPQSQPKSHRRASIRSTAERSKDAIRRASIRSIESITCRHNNRTDHLSPRSINSMRSLQSFQQGSLDEGDGAPQLRGILLARKAELSASQSDLRIPPPTFARANDNDDDISVLSEGDSSIAESLGTTPINSPQSSRQPVSSTDLVDYEKIEQEKHELQRMLAQLELETREMEKQIERTKSQNDLLRFKNSDPIEMEPQQEYQRPQQDYQQQQQHEYKRFVQPSAALKILSPEAQTNNTPVRNRPPIDSRQMAGLLAKMESTFPHIGLIEENQAKVEQYMESPATSIALLEARVQQLTVSPRSWISSPPNGMSKDDYDSESHSESQPSDYSSNTEPSSSDELETSQNFTQLRATFQQQKPEPIQQEPPSDQHQPQSFHQQPRIDSFEQDAGDWLMEQIARGNESLSQVTSQQPPILARPAQTAYPMAGIIPTMDDASMYSDSTWTFYTIKTNKTNSTRSAMTASKYLPQWTVQPTKLPTSSDEIRQYHDSVALSMASSTHSKSDYYHGPAMQRVPATSRHTRSDPPECGRAKEMDSPTSTLESTLHLDPPENTNQGAPLQIQPTIPEEEYPDSDANLPTIISFNSFEQFDDDEVSAISAKGRKVERTSKACMSPTPESVSTHMDHEEASLGDSDSSSELSDVGLMLQEIEDKDKLLKQLHDSKLFQFDHEPSDRSRSRSNKVMSARSSRILENKAKSTDEEQGKTKKKKLANARELLQRSKLASKRHSKNGTSDSEHEPLKPVSTLSLDTKRSSTTKSSKTRRTKSSERTESRSPRPSKTKHLDEVKGIKDKKRSQSPRPERKRSKSPIPSKAKDLDEVRVVKERKRSKSPIPSKAKDLDEVHVVKERKRSKSPTPSKAKDLDEAQVVKERKRSKSPIPSKTKDLHEGRAVKDRMRSKSPRPSKAKDIDEVPLVKDRKRSKSEDRGIGRTKSDKKNELSKSRSRSKSTEGLTPKFSSSRSIESTKSTSSKSSRVTSLSPSPSKKKKVEQRLRSKSNERSIATNSVSKKDKGVTRSIDKSKSLDNVERVARAAKVLERARSSRRDSSQEPKLKRASSKEEISIKSRSERSSSRDKKRTKSREGSSRRGTRRIAVQEKSNHSRSEGSERSRLKESSKRSRKVLKIASNTQSTTLKRPKSSESIGLRAASKRNDAKLESQSMHNDIFFLEIPKARSNDDLLSFSHSGNKATAISRYFEKSRKKDYLSYSTH